MDTKTPTQVKPIEIFRPGSFIASNGQQHVFTPAQVQELADTYNPAFSDAPLVVGHPKLTSPRYGHAGRLFVNGAGVLCADPVDVVPEFAQAIKAKHYPKVSASIYLPGAPGNPTPGKHYLRHIGFLGGAAPAVKGLASVEFSEDETGIVNFSYEDRLISQLFRNLRDWIIGTSGADKADEVLPSYSIDTLAEAAIRDDLAEADAAPAFSNPTQPTEAEMDLKKTLDDQAAALALKQKELDARALVLAGQEEKIKKAGHADFAETLIATGQLLPAQKATVVEIISQLDHVNQVADFAAGDENHGKTGTDLFKQFLAAQPKQIEYGRVSRPSAKAGIADFAAPDGESVDEAGLETLAKVNAYIKEHPGTAFIDAVKQVTAG